MLPRRPTPSSPVCEWHMEGKEPGNTGAWAESNADLPANTQGLSPPSYKMLRVEKPLLQGKC